MSMDVNFDFSIGDKVKTCFGVTGIVESASKGSSGITYWVETGSSQTTRWYKEEYLSLVEVESEV